MAGRLDGKIAVITGAASGLGRACAERFAEEGARVVVADLLADEGREVAASLEALGGAGVFVQTNTTREADNEALADAAVDAYGQIDIVIPAAGVAHSTYVTNDPDHDTEHILASGQDPVGHSFIYQPLEQWEHVLDVNLHGVMLTLRSTVRRIIDGGQPASIITLASILAKHPQGLGSAAYSVSKAGVWMLTKAMARDLAPMGIRVNSIGPGFFKTSMTAAISGHEELNQRTIEMIPMRRMGETRELANTALFLASDESSYFTGQLLHPDGGFLPQV